MRPWHINIQSGVVFTNAASSAYIRACRLDSICLQRPSHCNAALQPVARKTWYGHLSSACCSLLRWDYGHRKASRGSQCGAVRPSAWPPCQRKQAQRGSWSYTSPGQLGSLHACIQQTESTLTKIYWAQTMHGLHISRACVRNNEHVRRVDVSACLLSVSGQRYYAHSMLWCPSVSFMHHSINNESHRTWIPMSGQQAMALSLRCY